MHKVIQNKINKLLITLPIFGVIILSFLYINIYVGNALMNSSALTDTYNLTVTDNPSLTVTLNPGTPISLNPTAEGVFGSQDVGVNVMTTDDKGYTLTMSAATSSLSRSTADSSAPVIETLASATAQNDFPNNRWGFKRTSTKYTDTNFQPMLANYNVPVSSNGNITGSSGETSTLTFGVKLNTDIPSGEYSIAINFLAVNNVAPNLYYMQDATPSSLAAAMPNVHDTAVLYDRRDGQEYTVAKLKDGKYWMTKNLNLAGGIVLTSEDTDMAPGYTLPVANGFQEGNRLPEASKYGTGFTEQEMAAVYNSGNEEYTTGGLLSYYNWTATTLGSGVGIYEDNIDAPYSICPAGWKLPTSRTGEFTEEKALQSDTYQMAVQYGLSENEWLSQTGSQFCSQAGTCASTVPNIGMNGYYWNGELVNDGYAQYATATTSATPNDGANVRTLGYGYRGYSSPLRVWSSQSISRGLGFSVRCLFDDTMQSFSSDYASALAMEESVQLRDKRDNKQYWVTKLKDGNVWMTQNLDFDITGDTLSSTTTNLVAYGSEPYTSDKGYSQDSTTGEITWTPISTGATIITGRDKTGTNGEINYGTNAGKWVNSNKYPYSVDPGDWYQTGTYFSSNVCNDAYWSKGCNFLNSSLTNAFNGTTHGESISTYFRQTPYADNGTHGAIGNWYNWSAAVAANDTSAITSGTLTNSICPAGWELPANGKYGTINTNYNSNATSGALDAGLFAAPLYFVRGGSIYTVDTNTLYDAGRGGRYWSSTAYLADVSHILNFRSSGVLPGDGFSRGIGGSVRCLLRTE